jgi:hypothetical protein
LYQEFWILPAVKSIEEHTTGVWKTRMGHGGLRGAWGSEHRFKRANEEIETKRRNTKEECF